LDNANSPSFSVGCVAVGAFDALVTLKRLCGPALQSVSPCTGQQQNSCPLGA
jgi:hypothetical protein